MNSELDELWQVIAGDIAPDCYSLKLDLKDRWVRFHSLPESKRWPEDEAEMRSIVVRHNEILSDIFVQNEMLFVTEGLYRDNSVPLLKQARIEYFYWREMVPDLDDPEITYHLSYRCIKWSKTKLDSEIRDTANDDRANIMVIGSKTKIIYHPYDGGMDLILPSAEQRDLLQEKYRKYLSDHPEGL